MLLLAAPIQAQDAASAPPQTSAGGSGGPGNDIADAASYGPAGGPQVRPDIGPWPYVVLIGGNTADYVTTFRVQTLGAHEANPLLGQNVWVMLGVKAGTTAFVAWVMHELEQDGHPRAAKILGYSVGAALTAIAINNERFYRERRAWRRSFEH